MPRHGENLTQENKNNRLAYILSRRWRDHENCSVCLGGLGGLGCLGCLGSLKIHTLNILNLPNFPNLLNSTQTFRVLSCSRQRRNVHKAADHRLSGPLKRTALYAPSNGSTQSCQLKSFSCSVKLRHTPSASS